MYQEFKGKVYSLLHPEIGDTKWDKALNMGIIILIVLNVIAVMFETVPSIHDPYAEYFRAFDVFSVTVFTIEYLLRLWSANYEDRNRHSFHGRLKYILSPGALVDLLAILPFYLHRFIGFDLRILRILRLLRFLRLFRLTAYMKASQRVTNVFRNKKNELLLSFVLMSFLIIIASCIIYFAEHNSQPDVFESIPHTLWWSVITLTTVGYGDMYPITVVGKFSAGFILMIGVALFALPAGIITTGFLEEMRTERRSKIHKCPHCGEPIELNDHHH